MKVHSELGAGLLESAYQACLHHELREAGILVGLAGKRDDVLKIRPPLVFTDEHSELLVATLDRILG